MKNKKNFILLGVCLIIVVFSIVISWVLERKNKNKSVKEYVTTIECINSVNSLYGENLIDSKDFKNTNLAAGYKDIKIILGKLGLEDELCKEIKLSVGKNQISRSKWMEVLKLISETSEIGKICKMSELSVYAVEDKIIVSDSGKYTYSEAADYLVDKTVTAYTRENNIIFIKKTDDRANFENVIIKNNEKEKVIVSLSGIERKLVVKGLKEELSGVMADVKIENRKVVSLDLKRDSISGKVLAIKDNQIEIEGFGNVELEEKFRIYCVYDSFSEKNIEDIVIGEENLRFMVADKKICGILIDNVPNADNIRVLIKTSGYTDVLHDLVTISSKTEFDLIYYENDESGNAKEVREGHKAGDRITFDVNNEILKKGRVKLKPRDENGKMILESVSRNGSNPEYRGSIEITINSGKIVIVNELSLEEYLYAVVPSEMPSSYGIEALKVQAVCARSYAISHMNNDKLSSYGAQVDDSTSYQVYNSTPENENSISAVTATYGEALMYNGEIANTYFYATSCGSTTDSTIWGGTELPYIKGKMLSKKESNIDLTNNEEFSKFIKCDFKTYDSYNPWYRWNFKVSSAKIYEIVNANIAKIYEMYPEYVLTLNGDKYVSESISSLGNVVNIVVEKRGAGGIIEELVLVGTDATVKVIKQSAIRNLMNINGIALNKNDGSSVDTFTSLPSAFFTVEKVIDDYIFIGGGYGHGAGMSQTAVKAMIADNMKYEEILKFFYTDVEIKMVY